METGNLILETLRAIRTDMASMQDDIRDMKGGINGFRSEMAILNQHVANVVTEIAGIHITMGKLDACQTRIERSKEQVNE